ncbi:MAG: L,D-transpeptidase [Prolixibacteraceae bacterium]|nr:L,D-transpeptidase [Prolixibacteraceae bacterium]
MHKAFKKLLVIIKQSLAAELNTQHLNRWLKGIILTILLIFSILFLPGLLQKFSLNVAFFSQPDSMEADSLVVAKMKQSIQKQITSLNNKVNAYTPKSYYLIINSTRNEFFLYKGKNMVHHGKCSTGSYLQLENGENQKWLFKTPKGEFRIRGKTKSPVWKKPDWAFVEEGLPVPSENHSSRFEYGVLGDYALSLGYGYLIHGTIYQRFLGLPVTHGCIRLNDDDLEKIYQSLEIGSKVFIY